MRRLSIALLVTILLAGCGMSLGQKAQIAEFASATSKAVDLSTSEMIDIRNQYIEVRKERIIVGSLQVKDNFKLDKTLEADKVAKQVAAMELLQDYANSLNALALDDRSEAIGKAVTDLATSAEAAANVYKSEALTISDGQKKAAAGIAATVGGWYIEKKKKDAIKSIVEKYSPLVKTLAGHIQQDLFLLGNSPCWPEFRNGAEAGTKPVNDKTESGTLDVFCREADALREHSVDILKCKASYKKGETVPQHCVNLTETVRERALNDYLKMEQSMDNVAAFSKTAAGVIQKMLAANAQLSSVLASDKFTADDVKAQAAAIKELSTMVKVLAGNRKE